METASKEDINPCTENVESVNSLDTSHESNQFSANEKLLEGHLKAGENIQQNVSVVEFSENKQFDEMNINSYSFKENNDNTETNLQTNFTKCEEEFCIPKTRTETVEKSVNKSEEPITNDTTGEYEVLKKNMSETPQTRTQQYHEYASITEHIQQISESEQEVQSTEYTSEYMLEHHTENVYMPEQVQEQVSNLLASEQVYSTEIASDVSQDSTKELQIQNFSSGELGVSSENNFVSEYEAEHFAANENLSALEQTTVNKTNNYQDRCEESVKIEYTNPAVEVSTQSEVIGNTDNNTEDYGNVNKLINASIDGHIINDESEGTSNVTVENTPEESSEKIGYVYDVKEENNALEINLITDKRLETETASQSIGQVHIDQSNTEIIEIAHVSTASSENMTAESYTIADGLEVTEIQEGEYTIVEGPSSLDMSASHHGEESNPDGTLVLLQNYDNCEDNNLMSATDDQHELYLSELRSQSESRQSTSSQSSENRPRRGRKPTYDIPMHVLGHDISKPVETVPNGRALPKPRLGVKVPYRNLTSQIVSKAEIEKEIMERARLKQEQANARGDVLFARKLTQRLARKIAPSPDRPKQVIDAIKLSKEPDVQNKGTEKKIDEKKVTAVNETVDNSKIHNDSDLLAILEGEPEEMPVLPKEVPQPQNDDSNLKMLEREIALQQLQELPHQTAKQRIYRGRQIKSESKAPVLIAELPTKIKTGSKTVSPIEPSATILPSQNSAITKRTDQPLSNKENTTTKQLASKEVPSLSHKKELQNNTEIFSSKKQPIEIEPQVKVNMVLKTYSRKRKTTELPENSAESPVQKKTMLSDNDDREEKSDSVVSADVYVTKSSRIIKKKIIWDPAEIPSRSPKPVGKSEGHPAKTTTIRVIKPVEKNSNAVKDEKVIEKKITSEKLAKEKSTEKKVVEKSTHKKNSNDRVSSVEKKIAVTRTDSPKNKTPIRNKKSRSEVDKLLMDEGAVKMLYELKNTDEASIRKKKDVYSVEKAHKEIIKKANEIKSDLEQNTSNESPKSLRKKESFTPSPVKPAQISGNTERKMSKDSTRSSLHTPPGSPAYSFPHSQSSMLIRRRSSSSISSSDEIEADETKVSRKKSVGSLSDIPKPKRTKKNEDSKELLQTEKTNKELLVKPSKSHLENKTIQYKSFTVKKSNKHVNIDLNYVNENCFCTVQVLEELTSALWKYSKEKDCHVVSITSNSRAFCSGLDYASLISEKEDVCRKNATKLADCVRDLLLCLLKFPKVLVAGIQGDCVGLGVTMLPLFDMVIASDGATFSTYYASLGCMAEAGFLLSSTNLINHGLAAELLYTTQKLTADDAFRRGLVSRLCWPEKYDETLKNVLLLISKGSKQSLEATKKQLRSHIVQTTEAAINSETNILIENWISPECQKSFAKIGEYGK